MRKERRLLWEDEKEAIRRDAIQRHRQQYPYAHIQVEVEDETDDDGLPVMRISIVPEDG